MKKKKYWSGVFAMLGVAVIATAIFRESWFWGALLGIVFIYYGSSLYEDN